MNVSASTFAPATSMRTCHAIKIDATEWRSRQCGIRCRALPEGRLTPAFRQLIALIGHIIRETVNIRVWHQHRVGLATHRLYIRIPRCSLIYVRFFEFPILSDACGRKPHSHQFHPTSPKWWCPRSESPFPHWKQPRICHPFEQKLPNKPSLRYVNNWAFTHMGEMMKAGTKSADVRMKGS